MNNLPKVVVRQCQSGSQTSDLSIVSRTWYPQCHSDIDWTIDKLTHAENCLVKLDPVKALQFAILV